MKHKKRATPFELRDPIVPEVRGTASDAPDIVDANGAQTNSAEFLHRIRPSVIGYFGGNLQDLFREVVRYV